MILRDVKDINSIEKLNWTDQLELLQIEIELKVAFIDKSIYYEAAASDLSIRLDEPDNDDIFIDLVHSMEGLLITIQANVEKYKNHNFLLLLKTEN